jgi:RimJ/RimL family protein N-acetyltransferase
VSAARVTSVRRGTRGTRPRAKPRRRAPAVALAPLRPAQAPAIVRWLRDPVVSGNLGLRSTPTLAKTRAFIAAARRDDALSARAILLGDRHVGNVVLDQIDRRIGKARLHIYVGEASARGHGVGRRAVALALALAFDELGLHKVWLTVHARNHAAIRAYEAVGFAIEGVHRAEFLLGGERLDELYMGVLRPGVEITDPARR